MVLDDRGDVMDGLDDIQTRTSTMALCWVDWRHRTASHSVIDKRTWTLLFDLGHELSFSASANAKCPRIIYEQR